MEKNSMLFEAIENGEFEKVKTLISGGIDVNVKINSGSIVLTPLCAAVANKHKHIVDFLIKNGADVNFKMKSAGKGDSEGRTPLHIASDKGDVEILEMLISSGANVNSTSDLNSTPLDEAIAYWKNDIAEILLNAGGHIGKETTEFLQERGKTLQELKEDRSLQEELMSMKIDKAMKRITKPRRPVGEIDTLFSSINPIEEDEIRNLMNKWAESKFSLIKNFANDIEFVSTEVHDIRFELLDFLFIHRLVLSQKEAGSKIYDNNRLPQINEIPLNPPSEKKSKKGELSLFQAQREICSKCKGAGQYKSFGDMEKCSNCRGYGYINTLLQYRVDFKYDSRVFFDKNFEDIKENLFDLSIPNKLFAIYTKESLDKEELQDYLSESKFLSSETLQGLIENRQKNLVPDKGEPSIERIIGSLDKLFGTETGMFGGPGALKEIQALGNIFFLEAMIFKRSICRVNYKYKQKEYSLTVYDSGKVDGCGPIDKGKIIKTILIILGIFLIILILIYKS